MKLLSKDTEAVLAYAEEFLLSHSITPQQHKLFSSAISHLNKQTQEIDCVPFVHLPLLVYAGLRGDYKPAIPLAAATTMLYSGIDIFDDIADGDSDRHWEGYNLAEVSLIGQAMLCTFPQLLISEIDASPDLRLAMQKTIAHGLLKMAAGQHDDIANTGSYDVSSVEVEKSVNAKSGEELAMFAMLSAQLAGAPPDLINSYSSFGLSLGTAGQIASDCYELFEESFCRDLNHGTRTLPVAMHLERQNDAERAVFLNQLEKARGDDTVQEAIRQRLRSSGELRRCAFIVELYCQKARQAIEAANPGEPANSMLLQWIDSISFFPKGGEKR